MTPDGPARPLLSIVSPVYKAGNIVDELVRRLTATLSGIGGGFEVILIDDRSPDHSWKKIVENCSRHPFVKGIRLSRNFGQHQAISAGLRCARGDYVVVMDCDLQDNPKYIPDLLGKAREGYDVVLTSKKSRNHPFVKNIVAGVFFKIFNYLVGNEEYHSNLNVGTYSLLSRKVVDAFCRMKDVHRHYLIIVRLLGFSRAYVVIEHDRRFEGATSYTFSKLCKHALDGITSQSVRLLNASIGLGLSLFVASLAWAFYLVVNYFRVGALPGYTSTMAMLLLSTGLILMSVGILGIYIGRIFEQVKQRPLYFVDETANLDDVASYKLNGI
jgi:polyisoprenyl-phosphate glycosyltransferase